MGKIIPMPDIEYKSWCNLNKEVLEEIFRTSKINTIWVAKGNNRAFLSRWFKERGYTVTF